MLTTLLKYPGPSNFARSVRQGMEGLNVHPNDPAPMNLIGVEPVVLTCDSAIHKCQLINALAES